MRTWAGGTALVARPPGRDFLARLQPGWVIPGILPKKTQLMI